MPRYEPPRSDRSRLAFMDLTQETGTQYRAAGKPYPTEITLNTVTTTLGQFRTAYDAVSSKLSARSLEVEEQYQAVGKLQTYLRDLWEMIRRRTRRLGEPAAVLQFYGLPLDGINPNPGPVSDWLQLADEAIKGDADAVAAGYPAAVCPSAAEIQVVLDEAKAQHADVAPADRAFDDSQAAVAALRPEVDAVIQEVMDELRYFLRKEDAPSQRRIMRSYGATYRYLPGEPVDEE